jgi:hypothetical protein
MAEQIANLKIRPTAVSSRTWRANSPRSSAEETSEGGCGSRHTGRRDSCIGRPLAPLSGRLRRPPRLTWRHCGQDRDTSRQDRATMGPAMSPLRETSKIAGATPDWPVAKEPDLTRLLRELDAALARKGFSGEQSSTGWDAQETVALPAWLSMRSGGRWPTTRRRSGYVRYRSDRIGIKQHATGQDPEKPYCA